MLNDAEHEIHPAERVTTVLEPPQGVDGGNCPTCRNVAGDLTSPSYLYALGKIEARFPTLAVEKEFAQATGRIDNRGSTDSKVLHNVISRRENRYLARQLCWVMTIGGIETYILVPREASDLELLVDALRQEPHKADIDVVIGTKGPIAPPTMCNGLIVPVVVFDQIYSFDVESFVAAIPRPEKFKAEQFKAVAEEVFTRVMQLADNAGSSDKHRALNYLAMRYPPLYAAVAEAHARDASLSAVDVQSSIVGGIRTLVDVVLSFTHRVTDVTEKQFVRVDVTEEFPFLVTKLSPRFDINA